MTMPSSVLALTPSHILEDCHMSNILTCYRLLQLSYCCHILAIFWFLTVVVVRLSQRVILCHFHISPALELLELGMAATSIVNGQVRIWPGFGLKTVPGATNLVLGSQVHFHPMPEPDRCMIAFPQYIEQRWHATFFLGPKLDSWVEALMLSPAADKTRFVFFVSPDQRYFIHLATLSLNSSL